MPPINGEAEFVCRLHTSERGIGRLDVVAVIAGRDLVGRRRNLRGTPGLADIELADEVWKLLRGIVADRAAGELVTTVANRSFISPTAHLKEPPFRLRAIDPVNSSIP